MDSTGLGQLLAERLNAAGVCVLAGCLFEAEVERSNQVFAATNSLSVAFRLDVTDQASVQAAVQTATKFCERHSKQLFAVVSNA
jgi:NAD(P)-dependent dehydrogenase (short-subunit alcohol dehydrogenase family)